MQLTALNIFISAGEAVARAQKLLSTSSELRHVEPELVDGGVVLRRSVGPFALKLSWQVSTLATTNGVKAELVKVEPSLMGANISDALMKEIAKKLGGVAGVCVEGRAIRADAGVVLKHQFGVELAGVLREVAVTREGVSIRIEKGDPS